MIPVEWIRQQDYTTIVDWALVLTEKERLLTLKILQEADYSSLFPGEDVHDAFSLAKVLCARTYAEQKLFPISWPVKQTEFHRLLCSRKSAIHDSLITFFTHITPDYLEKVIKDLLLYTQTYPNVRLMWRLFQHGWIKFDELSFASALFHVEMYSRNVQDEMAWLRENPQIIETVILPFSQYDVPVLLRSHFHMADSTHHCGIVTEFWDDVFAQLYAEGRIPRTLIAELLSSLTLSFKKGRLDWHIRLIKMFAPSDDEWLANQHLLLAALYASNNTVLKFAVQTLHKISERNTFDHAAFMQHLPAITGREKCDKSLLLALDMIGKLAERFPEYRASLAQNISGMLLQQNEKVQLGVAQLMVKYSSIAELSPWVEPYREGLKCSVAALLQSERVQVSEHLIPALEYNSVVVPDNWDSLLFHTGKMLASKEVLDVELFYSGVIALQESIPADYKTQLQPYYKKLQKKYLQSTLLYTLRDFFLQWLTGGQPPMPEKYERRFPHLQNQNRLVLERLRDHCHLSLLSTPTHTPFYVSPQALVARLLEHERQQYPVDLDDLIVACNRILPGEVAPKVRQRALMLKGNYACAVHYLLGVTDEISAASDELLPLWTQVTRTRDANGVYPQFASLEQAAWPAVMQPLRAAWKVCTHTYEGYTWLKLAVNNQLRSFWGNDQTESYSIRYYYSSQRIFDCCSMGDFLYCLSLVPHYIDSLLIKSIPDTASSFDVNNIDGCIYPLQFLLENQLRVHHGGWIYIAVCLLFKKKVSRDLAAEYIQLALQQEFIDRTYLSECIADLLMHKFAPINRFIEYLNGYNRDPLARAFQQQILTACISKAEEKNLPVNYKKLLAFDSEFNSQGGEK
ncbi:hypothetical protein EYW98_13630 [Escherichia coli]|uniref:DUF6493 family protein n=1 Tax=Escherichia sp. MOD1-EC7003 TaxID=2093900 RepID=UPI000CF77C44|nr:DUF6493 family protein [Escherichia sp. MOD1-EC7003]EGO8360472.1 hypothetical protein [Escherichia coli]EGO8377960.1 hypothetical protein [Escherichia coli]